MSRTTQSSCHEEPELIALFDSLINSLCNPDGGSEFYRLHALDALLRLNNGIELAGRIDEAGFAQAHREISVAGKEVLPQFNAAVFSHAESGPEADQSVAWFHVTESIGQRQCIVAFGVKGVAGALRVGWCTLADRVEQWSYGEGLLQSLADYPWLRKGKPVALRALLDAAYVRRYWRAPLKFSTLPDARFSCQMSASCCKHDFEITLPAEAQFLIDAMPWQTVQPRLAGVQLPRRADGKLQLKALDETCRFLGSASQCLIHQTLGRQPFGTCSVFPYSFAETPDGIAVGLSPICGSTRLGFGVHPGQREEDLHERLVHAEPRRADAYRLAPGVELSWERFSAIEQGLCDCLAATDIPLRRRLYVASRLLGAQRGNAPIDVNAWLAEPIAEIAPQLRDAIHGILVRILGWDRAALRSLASGVPADMAGLEVRDAAIVTRILQNTLFCKVYSYPFDLTTACNFLILLYLLTIVFQCKEPGPLSDVLWRELGSLGVHGMLKSVLHEGAPEGFRALFGTAEFGQWMLAA